MKLSKIGLSAIAATLLISLAAQAKNEVRKAYVFDLLLLSTTPQSISQTFRR